MDPQYPSCLNDVNQNKTELSLLKKSFIFPSHQLFSDPQTSQLYNKLNDVTQKLSESQQNLIADAATKTKINSHYQKANLFQREHILDNCFVVPGVSLIEDKHFKANLRNRSYSIIKATLKRMKTITEEQFKQQIKNRNSNRQVIYNYDSKSIKTYHSQVITSRSRPNKPPTMKINQLMPNSMHESNKIDHSTTFTTRLKPYQPPSSMEIGKMMPTVEKNKKSKFSKINTESKEESLLESARKNYDFSRFEKSKSSRVRIKTMKSRKQEKEANTNFFNVLDQPLNQVADGIYGCHFGEFAFVEKKIKQSPWESE